jgi:thioredoxin-like negative regulator of GroEL
LADAATPLVREGEQALSQGDKARAYQLFAQATELAPRNEAAWLGRARAIDDLDETLNCLDQALAINPANMQAREARTFYRVRKLREGVRKLPEPQSKQRLARPASGGTQPAAPSNLVRTRRILLLFITLLLLLLAIALLYLRWQ